MKIIKFFLLCLLVAWLAPTTANNKDQSNVSDRREIRKALQTIREGGDTIPALVTIGAGLNRPYLKPRLARRARRSIEDTYDVAIRSSERNITDWNLMADTTTIADLAFEARSHIVDLLEQRLLLAQVLSELGTECPVTIQDNERSLKVRLNDASDKWLTAKDSAMLFHYNRGLLLMEDSSKKSYRSAWHAFNRCKQIGDKYNADLLLYQSMCKMRGTIVVGINPAKAARVDISKTAANSLSYHLHAKMKEAKSQRFVRLTYGDFQEVDYIVQFVIDSARVMRKISEPSIDKKTKSIQRPDGSTQKISATYREYQRYADATVYCSYIITDQEGKVVLAKSGLVGHHQWWSSWAVYSGDARCLSEAELAISKKSPKPFPITPVLIEDALYQHVQALPAFYESLSVLLDH